MADNSNPGAFDSVTVPKPSPGCDLVDPEWMQADSLMTDEYRELAMVHLESCDFCQRKVIGAQGGN